MKAVLVLDSANEYFYPLLEKDKSLSFLPLSLNSNLLSLIYSWVNSYFSKDKIFICCKKGEEEIVLSSCNDIQEENIIIEPERYSYSLSIYFASVFIEKIFNDSMAIFIPVNFINPNNLKMKNWILPVQEMVQNGWIVVPSVLLNKDDNFTPYLDAGKIISNIKGVDFFEVNGIFNNNYKKKIFGKQGGIIRLISAKFKKIIEYFITIAQKGTIYNKLYDVFSRKEIKWEDIEKLYYNIDREELIEIFNNNKNFLTIFLDIKPEYLHSWSLFFSNKLNNSSNDNFLQGNIISKNCKNVICFNYDEEEIDLDSLKNLVIVKKNGRVAIKNIL